MDSFLESIKGKLFSSFIKVWANRKCGAICIQDDGYITFKECTDDGKHYAVDKQGKVKNPVILTKKHGFVYWLIKSIQKGKVDFSSFYESCKTCYIEAIKNNPDYWKFQREPDKSFCPIHYVAIKEQMDTDKLLYDYLEQGDVELIKDYCVNYMEWFKKEFPFAVSSGNCDAGIPSELNSDKAKELFEKAIKAGLMKKGNDGFKWCKTKALCAYFADSASCFLDLGNTVTDTGKAAVWKPFEKVFGYKNLRTCKSDWRKTGAMPKGVEIVDKLFK